MEDMARYCNKCRSPLTTTQTGVTACEASSRQETTDYIGIIPGFESAIAKTRRGRVPEGVMRWEDI